MISRRLVAERRHGYNTDISLDAGAVVQITLLIPRQNLQRNNLLGEDTSVINCGPHLGFSFGIIIGLSDCHLTAFSRTAPMNPKHQIP